MALNLAAAEPERPRDNQISALQEADAVPFRWFAMQAQIQAIRSYFFFDLETILNASLSSQHVPEKRQLVWPRIRTLAELIKVCIHIIECMAKQLQWFLNFPEPL